jgi:hypothetical protein
VSYHVYFFLTSTITQLNWLLAITLLGRWLVRRAGASWLLAGAVLLWLAVPLAGSAGTLEEVALVPLVAVRYVRVVLFDVWPALAYRTFDLEWGLFKATFVHFHSQLGFAESSSIAGTPAYNALLLGLASMTALFARRMVPASVQDQLRSWMPVLVRPLWDNPWPAAERPARLWDINLCIMLLCLAPVLLVGPLAAIYLRARASHLLWPATWIAGLWSLSRVVSSGAQGLLFRAVDSKAMAWTLQGSHPVASLTLLRKTIGFGLFGAIPELLSALALAVACCATVPMVRSTRRSWAMLIALFVCTLSFQMLWCGWLPDMAPRASGAPLTIDDMRTLFPKLQ